MGTFSSPSSQKDSVTRFLMLGFLQQAVSLCPIYVPALGPLERFRSLVHFCGVIQRNVFVPETWIAYLSESCTFLNCSVSSVHGAPPSHFMFYLVHLPNQCIGTVKKYFVPLLHKSSARWCSWQINMTEYGKGAHVKKMTNGGCS